MDPHSYGMADMFDIKCGHASVAMAPCLTYGKLGLAPDWGDEAVQAPAC